MTHPAPWRLDGKSILDANGSTVAILVSEEAGSLLVNAPLLFSYLTELEREADLSLDYRTGFRRAISNAYGVLAEVNCVVDEE